MSDSHTNSPNPQRRSIFHIFTDPGAAAELGRDLGRAVRELRDALDPPSVPAAVYAEQQAHVVEIEAQMQALMALREQDQALIEHDQALIQQLVLQGAAQDKKLAEIVDLLQQSASARDHAQISRWQVLRQRLLQALTGLAGGAAVTGALRDAWVQEELYPLVKALPAQAQQWWEAWIQGARAGAEQPASPLELPMESPLPQPASQPASPVNQPVRAGRGFTLEIGNCPPLEMVTIPAGVFWMGSDKRRDPKAWDGETPQHQVHLDAYAIGRYPVTNVQYAVFVRSTQHRAPRYWQDGRMPAGKEQYPVPGVDWHDACAFCEWVSAHTRQSIRLASEAEWEKAARGTDGRIYPWGDAPPTPTLCNFADSKLEGTTPVGSYLAGASPYGVLDMAGNVWEWTGDWYDASYYAHAPARNPAGPVTGDIRVLRGGSYLNLAELVRCAYRLNFYPYRWDTLFGFRVVASPLLPPAPAHAPQPVRGRPAG